MLGNKEKSSFDTFNICTGKVAHLHIFIYCSYYVKWNFKRLHYLKYYLENNINNNMTAQIKKHLVEVNMKNNIVLLLE